MKSVTNTGQLLSIKKCDNIKFKFLSSLINAMATAEILSSHQKQQDSCTVHVQHDVKGSDLTPEFKLEIRNASYYSDI